MTDLERGDDKGFSHDRQTSSPETSQRRGGVHLVQWRAIKIIDNRKQRKYPTDSSWQRLNSTSRWEEVAGGSGEDGLPPSHPSSGEARRRRRQGGPAPRGGRRRRGGWRGRPDQTADDAVHGPVSKMVREVHLYVELADCTVVETGPGQAKRWRGPGSEPKRTATRPPREGPQEGLNGNPGGRAPGRHAAPPPGAPEDQARSAAVAEASGLIPRRPGGSPWT